MSKAIEKAAAILTKLGVDKDLIAVLKGEDETKIKEIAVDDIVAEIVDNQKEILSADPAFIDPIKQAERGAILTKREQVILDAFKSFGLTKEEYEALPEGNRTDALIKLAAKKAKESRPPDGDKDLKIQELAASIEARDAELKKLREEEIPSIETRFRTEREQELLSNKLRITFEKSLGSKLALDPDILYPAAQAKLSEKYDAKLEGGAVVLYDKGKTTKALKNAKPIPVDEAFLDIATESKILKAQEDPNPKPPVNVGGKLEVRSTHNDFQKAIEAKKAQMAQK